MKIISLIITILFVAFSSNAQSDNWKIYSNKKLLLTAKEENETKNVVTIKSADLKKSGQLSIEFHEGVPNKDWIRTFSITDDKDSILFEKNAMSVVRILNSSLKKMSAGKTRIKIYTWSLPRNPRLASTIRIRRVHLCTLEFE